MSINEKMTAIADAIRDVTGDTRKLSLDNMAACIPGVREVGRKAGVNEGTKAEYDRFWDALQENGIGGIDYRYKFFYWPNEVYKPKYPIWSTKTSMISVFANTRIENTLVDVDFSDTTTCTSAFSYATRLHTIPKLIVAEKNIFIQSFQGADALVNITIEGTFGNDINFQWSPLSVASMKSIISALKNFTGTGREHTKTVTFSEECWTALETDSTAPDGGTWKEYVYSTLCWNT